MFIFLPKNMHSYFLYRKSYVDLFMDLLKSMLFCLQILHNVCGPVLFTDLQKCIIFLHSFLKVLNLLIDLAKKYMFMFCLWTFQNDVIVFYLLIFQNIFTLILLKDLPNSLCSYFIYGSLQKYVFFILFMSLL